jgi:hypothetical protein
MFCMPPRLGQAQQPDGDAMRGLAALLGGFR